MTEKKRKDSIGSQIIRGLREFAEALEKKESINEKFNCRVVELDLRPTSYDADMVKETRRTLKASQAVFARLLGVSVKTVRAWEQGVNTPSDMAARFMDEIRFNPKYWFARLQQSATAK
jgi:putative transcriptional regulator